MDFVHNTNMILKIYGKRYQWIRPWHSKLCYQSWIRIFKFILNYHYQCMPSNTLKMSLHHEHRNSNSTSLKWVKHLCRNGSSIYLYLSQILLEGFHDLTLHLKNKSLFSHTRSCLFSPMLTKYPGRKATWGQNRWYKSWKTRPGKHTAGFKWQSQWFWTRDLRKFHRLTKHKIPQVENQL